MSPSTYPYLAPRLEIICVVTKHLDSFCSFGAVIEKTNLQNHEMRFTKFLLPLSHGTIWQKKNMWWILALVLTNAKVKLTWTQICFYKNSKICLTDIPFSMLILMLFKICVARIFTYQEEYSKCNTKVKHPRRTWSTITAYTFNI